MTTFATEDTALHLEPLVTPDHAPEATITERWVEFDRQNPHVRRLLIDILERVRRGGAERYSIKGAFEVARYSSLVTNGSDYKLNNDFSALYARAICDERPDLAPMLSLRERRAA